MSAKKINLHVDKFEEISSFIEGKMKLFPPGEHLYSLMPRDQTTSPKNKNMIALSKSTYNLSPKRTKGKNRSMMK